MTMINFTDEALDTEVTDLDSPLQVTNPQALNPSPGTLHPRTYTPNPHRETLNPKS